MGNLQAAYNWAIQECNRPNVRYGRVGYSDTDNVVDGITYWDCSSFIWKALKEGGYDVGSQAFYTGYGQMDRMLAAGFTLVGNYYPGRVPSSFQLRNGDVLLRGARYWGGAGYDDGQADDSNDIGHTEMVYDATRKMCMGSHSAQHDDPNDMVSIRDWDNSAFEGLWWYYVLRDNNSPEPMPDGSSGTMVPITPSMLPVQNESGYSWHHGSVYGYEPDSNEAIDNAKIITWFLYRAGWCAESIAAFLGNVQRECGFEPDAQEVGGEGYGLIQWTPASVLYNEVDILYGNDGVYSDGTCQMNVILMEYANANYNNGDEGFSRDYGVSGEWIVQDGSYWGLSIERMSYWEWAHNSKSQTVGDLAKIYMVDYGRPAKSENGQLRAQYAEYWYGLVPGFIAGFNWGPYNPDVPVKKKNRRMPVWMMVYPMAWQLTSM